MRTEGGGWLTTERIRVLVADDHPLFRLGLKELLEREEDLEVVAEASDGFEAVSKAVEFEPDVILMDIRMPGQSGIDASRQIKERLPETEVLVVTAADDERQIMDAIAAGVSGCVIKDEAPGTLPEAVRYAHQGKAYLPPSVAKQLLRQMGQAPRVEGESPGEARLGPRELTILRMMAEGKRNREIAAALGISERTVGYHIANIYTKLGVSDRSQAVRAAIKTGLVSI